MDSRAVADQLGTDTKTLRRFLRSSASSAEPVGSGGRYAFTESQIPTMKAEFESWCAMGGNKSATVATTTPTTKRGGRRKARSQADRDRAVWEEEGDVVLPDIRIPAVRAAVRAQANARVERLEHMLRERGLHVSQMRDRVPA